MTYQQIIVPNYGGRFKPDQVSSSTIRGLLYFPDANEAMVHETALNLLDEDGIVLDPLYEEMGVPIAETHTSEMRHPSFQQEDRGIRVPPFGNSLSISSDGSGPLIYGSTLVEHNNIARGYDKGIGLTDLYEYGETYDPR